MNKVLALRDPVLRATLLAGGVSLLADSPRRLKSLLGGLGVSALAFLALPDFAPELAGAALGVGSAGLLLIAWSVLPLIAEPRPGAEGVLVLGREDLASQLCADLLSRRRRTGGAEPSCAIAPGMVVDPLELRQLVQRERIARIVVAQPDAAAREQIIAALLECRLLGVQVEDAAELYQRLHGKLWIEAIDPGLLIFADGFRITPSYRAIKRVLDVAFAVAMLIVTAPLMALIALGIKLESAGPVLFRQERVGQFGAPFVLMKFRSMRMDAEAAGPAWAKKNDARATRFGRFLRKTHLDELPQVINVLRGDLSFVGPRPERGCFVELLARKIPYYDLRHYVKPGVTGWAQVCYPYAESIEDSYEKLQYDLYYARCASLRLDLRILLRTAATMLLGRGQ